MPFTVKEFPGQVFKTVEELEEARRLRKGAEDDLAGREVTQVTATVIPAPRELVLEKLVCLEKKVSELEKLAADRTGPGTEEKPNKEGLRIGTILQGESRGQKYTLEVLDEDYLCSDGNIYQSLSGAASGVSGNRRSGWKFWKDIEGTPVGTTAGRFKSEGGRNPFRAKTMS